MFLLLLKNLKNISIKINYSYNLKILKEQKINNNLKYN